MCGIWGMVSKHSTGLIDSEIKHMRFLSIITSLRGAHSTGYMSARYRELKSPEIVFDHIKSIGSPYTLWGQKTFPEWLKKQTNTLCLVGHGRHATAGEINDANAHPFKVGPITFLHNGTINYGLNVPKGATDSETVAKAFVDIGVKETLKKIMGAYVFVWLDSRDNTLNIVKNYQRPLHVLEEKNCIYFASEEGFLELFKERELSFANKTSTIEKVKEYEWLKWDLENRCYLTPENVSKECSVTSYSHTPPPPTVKPSNVALLVPKKNANTEYSFYDAFKGKDVVFYVSEVETSPNGRIHTFSGSTISEGSEEEYPVLFRTQNKGEFLDLMNSKVLEGYVNGRQKHKGMMYLSIKTKSIEEVELLYTTKDDKTITLADGMTITKADWKQLAVQNCDSCLEPVDIEDAEYTIVRKTNTGSDRLLCGHCTHISLMEKYGTH